jgi:phage recombination protein Bet
MNMTNTQTRTPQRQQTATPPTSQGQVAVIAPPRMLPPAESVLKNYDVDNQGWRTLVESIFPAAKTPTSVIMALDYCKRRKLDVFKHPVHIVPIWNSQASDNGKGAMVETIWPGINELRTTAIRTGQYAGMDVPTFGPMIDHTFKGRIKKWQNGSTLWEDVQASVRFPEWCQITVYRTLANNRIPFPGPRVYWLETYARLRNDVEVPNSMWEKRANGQLEKCAEAAALRRAFPEELGSDYSIDEIGAFTTHQPADVTADGSATTEPPAEPRREDFAAPTQTDNQSSGGMPHNDTPPAAGQGAATQRDGAPTGGGTSASGQPGAAAKPKPAGRKAAAKAQATDVVDENEGKPEAGETAARPVVDGEIDTEIKFDRYSSAGAFYDFSDTFLQSAATTPAMARAWRTFYDPQISQFLAHERETVRAEINDTLTLYLKKVGIAPDPQQQREPGEEG